MPNSASLPQLTASHVPVLSPALGGRRLSQVRRATLVEASLRVSRLSLGGRSDASRDGSCLHFFSVGTLGLELKAANLSVGIDKFAAFFWFASEKLVHEGFLEM